MAYELTIIGADDTTEVFQAADYATMREAVVDRLPGPPVLITEWTHYNCERIAAWSAFGQSDFNLDASTIFLIQHGPGQAEWSNYMLFGPIIIVKEV